MEHLTRAQSGLTRKEYGMLARLTTPTKIQDFLDTLAMNFEKKGDTHLSPRRVLLEGKAHCIEGALVAALALWLHGESPLVMNLSPRLGKGDFDHVITLYKRGGAIGAISKTNHASLRFRDPIYRTPRELALSYFREWFLPKTGEKVLECYSRPLDLRRFGTGWISAEGDVGDIAEALSVRKHYYLMPKGNWRHVRSADRMELKAEELTEWSESDPRT